MFAGVPNSRASLGTPLRAAKRPTCLWPSTAMQSWAGCWRASAAAHTHWDPQNEEQVKLAKKQEEQYGVVVFLSFPGQFFLQHPQHQLASLLVCSLWEEALAFEFRIVKNSERLLPLPEDCARRENPLLWVRVNIFLTANWGFADRNLGRRRVKLLLPASCPVPYPVELHMSVTALS